MVEDVADAAAGAFGDLAGAFGGAYSGVLGSDAYSFADAADAFHGVKRDDVGCALAGAFGYATGGFAGTFADVAGTAPDIATGGAGLGLGGRRGLLLLAVRGCGCEGHCAGDEECEEEAADLSTHERASFGLDARA
jgi:hypothetical protein